MDSSSLVINFHKAKTICIYREIELARYYAVGSSEIESVIICVMGTNVELEGKEEGAGCWFVFFPFKSGIAHHLVRMNSWKRWLIGISRNWYLFFSAARRLTPFPIYPGLAGRQRVPPSPYLPTNSHTISSIQIGYVNSKLIFQYLIALLFSLHTRLVIVH